MTSDAFLAMPTAVLALALGFRHGLDADHLASIDGLARWHLGAGRTRAARASGLLFSLGHGAVLLAAVLAVLSWPQAARLPDGLETGGRLVSVVLLAWIGVINLAAAGRGDGAGSGAVAPLGPLARLAMRAPFARSPAGALWVGALFAFSFDTLAQAATFALGAGAAAGALLAAVSFVAGMAAADALNGWLVARAFGGGHGDAPRVRRAVAALAGALSLAVAGWGLAGLLSPTADALAEAAGAWPGIGLSVLAVCSALWLRRASRGRKGVPAVSRAGR